MEDHWMFLAICDYFAMEYGLDEAIIIASMQNAFRYSFVLEDEGRLFLVDEDFREAAAYLPDSRIKKAVKKLIRDGVLIKKTKTNKELLNTGDEYCDSLKRKLYGFVRQHDFIGENVKKLSQQKGHKKMQKQLINFNVETAMREGVEGAVILDNIEKISEADPVKMEQIYHYFHFIKPNIVFSCVERLVEEKKLLKNILNGILFYYKPKPIQEDPNVLAKP